MDVLIEDIEEARGKCYIFVRIPSVNFVLTDNATLAGVSIKSWVEQPRKLKEDGTQDKDVFVLALRNIAGIDWSPTH